MCRWSAKSAATGTGVTLNPDSRVAWVELVELCFKTLVNGVLFWRTLLALPLTWRQRRKVFEQFHEVGNAACSWSACCRSSSGRSLRYRTGPVLVERGLTAAVGGIVGISICKELAPVMMAILIAGRNGSAMAAEIGSMRVYQEVDALRTMNINPVHYLVLPRLVAIAVALPLLVIVAIMVGWFGGAVVSANIPKSPLASKDSSRTARHRFTGGRGSWRVQELHLRADCGHGVVPPGVGHPRRPAGIGRSSRRRWSIPSC